LGYSWVCIELDNKQFHDYIGFAPYAIYAVFYIGFAPYAIYAVFYIGFAPYAIYAALSGLGNYLYSYVKLL
jgi:hypothetical protein